MHIHGTSGSACLGRYLSIVKDEVHRAIDTDEFMRLGSQNVRLGLISMQFLLCSGLMELLKAVFEVLLGPIGTSHALFRPFGAVPPP